MPSRSRMRKPRKPRGHVSEKKPNIVPDDAFVVTNQVTLEELNLNYLIWTLKKCNYNRTKTADALGIDYRTVFNHIKKYGIDIPEEIE